MGIVAGAALAATSATASAAQLSGAGSTLVAPIEAEWGAAWASTTNNEGPNYQAVGSGTGLKDIGQGLVDFGASDAPLSASTTACPGCFQIPWALSATGVSFNVPGVHRLHLTGSVLAQIWLGQITNWSDPRIKALNKRTHFPNLPITPLHRSDGSGDSYAFTDYLTSASAAWAHQVGRAEPGRPLRGAESEEHLERGVDRQGRSRQPGTAHRQSVQKGQDRLPDLDVHLRHLQPTDPLGNGALLKSFVAYALGSGQRFAPGLDFVPLPAKIKNADEAALGQIH